MSASNVNEKNEELQYVTGEKNWLKNLVFDFESLLLLFCFRLLVHYYYYNDLQNSASSSRVDIWAFPIHLINNKI